MRLADATIPPFLMSGMRFATAGLLLYAWCAVSGRGRIVRGDLVRAAVSGVTLLVLGTGVMSWTVQFVPTGVSSLLISASPIWMAMIAFVWGGERPTRIAVCGMILGLVGLAYLVRPDPHLHIAFVPAIISVLGSVSWAFGSIYQRRLGPPRDFLIAAALQMIAGGLVLVIIAFISGEARTFDFAHVSVASMFGWGWLVVFGSLVGYVAYLHTMQHASTALASTYAYVNPVVAIIVGFFVFGEHLSIGEGIASMIIIAGVALMMLPARRSYVLVPGAEP